MQDLNEVRSIPIVDIYNRYIGGKLITRGRYFWCHCPWHGSDSEPSLKLYPSQNSWWCYGCQAGGSQIDMVMHALGLTIKDAIKKITNDYRLTDQPTRYIKHVNVNEMFEKDFSRVFMNLSKLNRQLVDLTRNVKMCIKYPAIFMYQLTADDLLENMCSADKADQVAAWRQAKEVFNWM